MDNWTLTRGGSLTQLVDVIPNIVSGWNLTSPLFSSCVYLISDHFRICSLE
jgi:hypothetical protein